MASLRGILSIWFWTIFIYVFRHSRFWYVASVHDWRQDELDYKNKETKINMLGLFWNVAVLSIFAKTQIVHAKEAQIQVPISFGCFFFSKGIIQRYFPQQKCKSCVCYLWFAIIKAVLVNSNGCNINSDFYFQHSQWLWYCSFTFVFNHLKAIWFKMCFCLYTNRKQCNIYGKPFHPVYIAHWKET